MTQWELHHLDPPQNKWQHIKAAILGYTEQHAGSLLDGNISYPRVLVGLRLSPAPELLSISFWWLVWSQSFLWSLICLRVIWSASRASWYYFVLFTSCINGLPCQDWGFTFLLTTENLWAFVFPWSLMYVSFLQTTFISKYIDLKPKKIEES